MVFLVRWRVDHKRSGTALLWLSDETWAVIKPHLPKSQAGAGGRLPTGDLGHRACAEGRPSLCANADGRQCQRREGRARVSRTCWPDATSQISYIGRRCMSASPSIPARRAVGRDRGSLRVSFRLTGGEAPTHTNRSRPLHRAERCGCVGGGRAGGRLMRGCRRHVPQV